MSQPKRTKDRLKLPPINISRFQRDNISRLVAENEKCKKREKRTFNTIKQENEKKKENVKDKIQLHRVVMKNSRIKINQSIKSLQIEVNKLVNKKSVSGDFRRLRSKIDKEFSGMKKKMEAVIRS